MDPILGKITDQKQTPSAMPKGGDGMLDERIPVDLARLPALQLKNVLGDIRPTLRVPLVWDSNKEMYVLDKTGGMVISGAVSVSNLLNPHPVSGTVAASNLLNPHPVSGTVAVSNLTGPASACVDTAHTIGTTLTKVADADANRKACIIWNENSSNDLFIAFNSGSTAKMSRIGQLDRLVITYYTGEIWVRFGTGSSTVVTHEFT